MIPHNKPSLNKKEEQAAIRVLRSSWVAQGKEVEKFENEFCHFLGQPDHHAVAVSSGTAALFLALQILRAKNQKVAIPAYACSSLRHAIALAQAKEELHDSEKHTPNIDPHFHKISKAKFAILPHMYGLPIDIKSIRHIHIIEDCAQAIGARIHGKACGLHGTIGIFSFSATKLITSGGQGGMLVSQDKSLVDAIRDYREFDCRHDQKKRFNFQMTDLQAAIGREQLKKLPDFLKKREEVFRLYQKAGFDLLDLPKNSSAKAVRYRAILKTKNARKMIETLSSHQIQCIIPTEDWELLGKARKFPNAYYWTQNTLSLPIYPSLKKSDVKKVIQEVKKLI